MQKLQRHNTFIAAQWTVRSIAGDIIPLSRTVLMDTVFFVVPVIRFSAIPHRVIPIAAIGPAEVTPITLFARCPDPAVIASIGCRVVLRVIVDGDQMAAIVVEAPILGLTPGHRVIAHDEVIGIPIRFSRGLGCRRGSIRILAASLLEKCSDTAFLTSSGLCP